MDDLRKGNLRMKVAYETPAVERLTFDYDVTACCSKYPYCEHTGYTGGGSGSGSGSGSGGSTDDPNGQYFKCVSPNYFGC